MDWVRRLQSVYGLKRGDLHFLSIDGDGDLVLQLGEARKKLKEIYLNKSVTLRIPQLINSQIQKSLETFHEVATRFNFNAKFKPLYPIKVNQRKMEVSTVIKSSPIFGLESGTKSEFVICNKMFKGQEGRIIMSNGVKDRGYFELMKKSVLEGHRVFISIEGIKELQLALEVIPHEKLELFLRVKPYSILHGKWGTSSGRDSKFGMSIHEIDEALKILQEEGVKDKLIGIHAHPGSQVTNFYELREYSKFLSSIFKEINDRGFELRNINFGGGLPIDYEGWMEENIFESYYEAIFGGMSEIFKGDYPNVLTESGRAITALSSMVLIEVLDVYTPNRQMGSEFPENLTPMKSKKILEYWQNLPQNDDYSFESIRKTELLIETQKRELRRRFFSSPMYCGLIKEAKSLITPNHLLLGNFSIFNSACDSVLVNQYFPIIPNTGLNEQPQSYGRLIDITCDSDGEISNFCPRDIGESLFTKDGYPLSSEFFCKLPGFPIPDPQKIDFVVIPLIGAYQDIIQFDHNLIGDLPDILVHEESGEIKIQELSEAQDISTILKKVGYTVDLKDYPYILQENSG